MSEWEPATDAEVAMRDALRTDDQESYFRILAGVDLLLPVSADALAGLAPLGWGTWSTGGSVSCTLMLKLQDELLLAASVAVQVSMVVPSGKVLPDGGTQPWVGELVQLSVADEANVATAPPAVHSSV